MGAQSDQRRANGVAMCGGTNRQGQPCGYVAGYKTSHVGWGNCTHHGGSTPSGIAAALREQVEAEVARLGGMADVSPDEALEVAVQLATGTVFAYRRKLAELEEAVEATGQKASPAAYLKLGGMLMAELEKLSRIAKAAADSGVAERRLELDALILDQVSGAITKAITDAGLGGEESERLKVALARRFRELGGDTRPGLPA